MPSLYESTVNTGEVSSSNFTTLYNASGLQVPNAGAGQITGNLNVGGNLTVQGSSLLIGEVTLQSTLSLPNYQFPIPDGSTFQVMVTDGNGNLYWDDVNLLPGADYNISATTATGGANLTLANTAGFTDSVKFAAGTNIGIVRTDANTITISTVADNIPDGTGKGQVLYWDGSAWTANSTLTFDSTTYRSRFVNNVTGGITAADFLKQYSGTLTDGSSVAQLLGFTDGSTYTYNHRLRSEYDTTANPIYRVQADPVGNFGPSSTTVYTQLYVDNTYLGINGSELVLLGNVTGAPTQNAVIRVNRGTETDATITWDETTDNRWELNNDLLATGLQGGNVQIAMGGGSDNEIYIGGNNLLINTDGSYVIQSNSPIQTTAQSMSINSDSTNANSQLNFKGTTQYLKWNDSTVQYELSNGILIGGNTYVNGIYSQTGESMTMNSDNTAADSYLYMKGSTEYLKWNNTDTRFELSDQLYISQTDVPAVFERRNTTSEINTPLEFKSGIRLTERVTDAPDNDTTSAGPGITFSRTSGASDTTERLFASMGAVWDGATQTVNYGVSWSNDNYSEPTPGNFPGTYTLLRMGSNDSEFYNNSIYIDYSAQGTTHTATSITGGNTLVFGSAHGYSSGDRIQYTSTTQNGLTQNAYYYVIASGLTTTQCQLGLTSTGTAIALTNGTGLTLVFADMINRVGVNMNNPQYTLDVNGDANVSGDIYVSGVHVDLDVPVHQGQLLYVSDESPATITNSSTINFADVVYRPNFQQKNNIYGRTASGLTVSNTTGAVNYTTGDGGSMLLGIQSDSQALDLIGAISTAYDTSGDHELRLSTSTGDFANDKVTSITGSNTLVFSSAHGFSIGSKIAYLSATQNGLVYGTTYYVISTGFTTTQCQVSLTLGGSAVALTNGTGLSLWFNSTSKRLISATSASVDILAPTLLFNATNTGIPGVNAGLEVERGTDGANSTFIWSETNNRWEASEDFFVQKATIGFIDIDRTDGQIDTNSGYNLTLDSDGGTVFINDNLNVDAGVLYVDAGSNEVGVNTVTPAYPLDVNGIINTNSAVQCDYVVVDSQATLDTNTITTTSTATVSLNATARNAMTGLVNIIQGANVHCVNFTAVRVDATTALLTTYAEMYNTSSLASFTADVSGGNLRLLVTPTSATSTVFSAVRTSLT